MPTFCRRTGPAGAALALVLAAPVARAAPQQEQPPPMPRLTLAGGFVVGPHAHGEASCQSRGGVSLCEHTGNFFGVGGNLELRGQLFGPLYLHLRGLIVGNVRARPYGVHKGLFGGGIGLGAYSRLAFIRAEYMFVPTLGPNTYRPPFYEKEDGRDVWGRHAGMISAGVRKYATARLAFELWAGIVIGPRSRRTSLSEQAAEDRTIVSFVASLGIAFDVLPARGWSRAKQAPPPAQPVAPAGPATYPASYPPPASHPAPQPMLAPPTAQPGVATPAQPGVAPSDAPAPAAPAEATAQPAATPNPIGPWQPTPQ